MRLSLRFSEAQSIAANRFGLLTTADLRSCGFDHKGIRLLCQDGLIERVIHGLYRIRGTKSPLQDIAAALSRHHGAVASHRSAGFVHELVENPGEIPTITLPRPATGHSSLAVGHRSPIERCDVTSRNGLAVTSVARTIVDLGAYLTDDELAGVLNVAVSGRQVTIRRIAEAITRSEAQPGRTGHARLRRVLAPWTDEIRPDTPAEAVALRRIHDFGLPMPQTQHTVNDRDGGFIARVDLAWPSQRVVREYDSVLFHGPERTEVDELRRQAIEAAGWTVGVITRVDLRPGEVRWLRSIAADISRFVKLVS